MGSLIELNDTLQLTVEQGFPAELDLERHLKQPIGLEAVKGKVFEFKNKPAIRNYQQTPVRVFLVQNIGGKWVYWGLVQVLEVTHDYVGVTTSGKFKITRLNTPDEMKQMFELTDGREEFNYFFSKEGHGTESVI
jgi:hypothetical protein